MPENVANIAILLLYITIGVLVIGSVLVRTIKNRYILIKCVNAVVIDKNIVKTFSKYSGNGKYEKYVVVFSIEGKKKSFYVSQFSYDGYRINEKGTLKYKGDKLIEFK